MVAEPEPSLRLCHDPGGGSTAVKNPVGGRLSLLWRALSAPILGCPDHNHAQAQHGSANKCDRHIWLPKSTDYAMYLSIAWKNLPKQHHARNNDACTNKSVHLNPPLSVCLSLIIALFKLWFVGFTSGSRAPLHGIYHHASRAARSSKITIIEKPNPKNRQTGSGIFTRPTARAWLGSLRQPDRYKAAALRVSLRNRRARRCSLFSVFLSRLAFLPSGKEGLFFESRGRPAAQPNLCGCTCRQHWTNVK